MSILFYARNFLLVSKLSKLYRFESCKYDISHFEKNRFKVSQLSQGFVLALRTSNSSHCTTFCTMIKHIKLRHLKSHKKWNSTEHFSFYYHTLLVKQKAVKMHFNQQAHSQKKQYSKTVCAPSLFKRWMKPVVHQHFCQCDHFEKYSTYTQIYWSHTLRHMQCHLSQNII